MASVAMLPPIHCCVQSRLLEDDILLNLHPDTAVFRVLQYVFEQIRQGGTNDNLLNISEYTLQYNENEVLLNTLLKDVDPFKTTNVFLNLKFIQRENMSGIALNLDYDFVTDFDQIDLKIEFNILQSNSNNPIETLPARKVSLSEMKGSKLLKLTLNKLNDLENDLENETFCSMMNNHSFEDFMAFKILGNDHSHTVTLNDGNSLINDNFMDSSLKDILNFEFAPKRNSVFTVMLYVRHDLQVLENSTDLNLISDFPLLYDKMKVNSMTKIIDIIKFIKNNCILNSKEFKTTIKLLFKGKVIPEKDNDGNDINFMEFINGEVTDKNTNIHVQISTDVDNATENFDDFWFKRYSVKNTNHSSVENIITNSNSDGENNNTMTNDIGSSFTDSDENSGDINNNKEDEEVDETENILDLNDGRKFQLVTESGLNITPLEGTYTKCLIDNKEEVFIETRYLELLNAKINLPNGSNIPLDSLKQVKISENYVEFESELVSQMEKDIEMELLKEDASQFVETVEVESENGFKTKAMTFFRNSASFMWLILNTLYLLLRGAVFLFLILFELTMFLPTKYIVLITLVCIIRTFMSNREILDLWIDYFNLNAVSEDTIQKIQRFVDMGRVSDTFYKELLDDEKVEKLFRLDELHNVRHELYQRYKIDYSNNRPDEECLNELLTKFQKGEISKRSMDIFVSKIIITDEIEHIENESKLVNQMLLLIKRYMETQNTSEYPFYRRLIQKAKIKYDRLYRTNPFLSILDHIVPNPVKNNWFVSILKNVILFTILLIPLLNGPVDKVLNKRRKEIEEYKRQQADRQAKNDGNGERISANNEGSNVPLLNQIDLDGRSDSDHNNSDSDDTALEIDEENEHLSHINTNTDVDVDDSELTVNDFIHENNTSNASDHLIDEAELDESNVVNEPGTYTISEINEYDSDTNGETVRQEISGQKVLDVVRTSEEEPLDGKNSKESSKEGSIEPIREEEPVELESSVSTETPVEITPTVAHKETGHEDSKEE